MSPLEDLHKEDQERRQLESLLEESHAAGSLACRYSKKIAAEELTYLNLGEQLLKMREVCKRVESDLLDEIANEFSAATGKARFSNEQARLAELGRRKTTDLDWQTASSQRDAREREQSEQRVLIDLLTREYQLAKLAYEVFTLGHSKRSSDA